MTTENPVVGPEESVPVRCARCGETVTTALNEWRHKEMHVDEDRAMLRSAPRKPPESRFIPLRLAISL